MKLHVFVVLGLLAFTAGDPYTQQEMNDADDSYYKYSEEYNDPNTQQEMNYPDDRNDESSEIYNDPNTQQEINDDNYDDQNYEVTEIYNDPNTQQENDDDDYDDENYEVTENYNDPSTRQEINVDDGYYRNSEEYNGINSFQKVKKSWGRGGKKKRPTGNKQWGGKRRKHGNGKVEYESVGCFRDTPFRAISGNHKNFPRYQVINSCYLKAKAAGNQYFAVQHNTQCFTSANAGKTYKKYGAANGCKDGRGGTWKMSVYKLSGIQQVKVPGYGSVGCFKDTPTRAISGGHKSFRKEQVINSCYLKAKAAGNQYFGVQYNTQCFTSANAGKTYKRYGATTGCSNGRGGTWKMSVYKLTASPVVSCDASGNRIRFKCEFPTTGERIKIYEVFWFYATQDGEVQITRQNINNNVNVTYLVNGDKIATEKWVHVGYTVYVKVRSYMPGQDMNTAGFQRSNDYYVGFKFDPPKLSLSESARPVNLKIISTVPILCGDGSNCTVLVRLIQSHPSILISTCTLVFKPASTLPISQTVTVMSKRDFINNGNQKLSISLVVSKSPAVTASDDWYNATSSSTVNVVTESVSSGQCTSSGDPHFRTFDNAFFNHYRIGDYTLVQSQARNFKIHVRTHRCAKVACNCGVAVQEGDDVLVVDMCQSTFSPIPRYASNREPATGTYIERSANGKSFLMRFASGAFVKFVAKHWYKNNYYADLTVQVPPDDYGKTVGLCGIFDKNKNNDMSDKKGKIYGNCGSHACSKFTESWKLTKEESLFYTNPLRKSLMCYSNSNNSHCICNSDKEVCNVAFTPPLLKKATQGYTKLVFSGQADCDKLRGDNKKKPGVTIPACNKCIYPYEPPTVKPVSPTWPTKDGITKSEAKKKCNDGIRKTDLYEKCKKYVSSAMMDGFIGQCISDIQILDTKGIYVAIEAANDAFKTCCVEHITTNPDVWKKDKDGKLKPPTDVTNLVCPNQCSNKGNCVEGSCVCKAGYLTEDCSVKKGQIPKIIKIRGGSRCIVGGGRDCFKISVIGQDIVPSQIKCYTAFNGRIVTAVKILPAKLISFSEVSCERLPAPPCGERFLSTNYLIKLVNGDAVSNGIDYQIVNPKCKSCGKICRQKKDVCVVNGCCYQKNEKMPGKGNPRCTGHPCDSGNGGCDDKCLKKGDISQCSCTAPGTVLGEDNKSCVKVNPCATQNGGCAGKCLNKDGSAQCSCTAPGKTLGKDNKSCVNVDHCAKDNGGCAGTCVSKGGSAECGCPNGQKLRKDNRSCVKVNPCATQNGGCAGKCLNKDGSAQCSCTAPGKTLGKDNKSCVNVNPCATQNGGCAGKCLNKDGSAQCSCTAPGKTLGKDNRSCVNANPCGKSNGGCDDKCLNKDGSAECSCTAPGAVLGIDRKSCSQAFGSDPCGIENGGCAGTCVIKDDSAQCSCTALGTVLGEDNKSCVKVNPCGKDNGGCDDKCLNKDGSAQCSCTDPGKTLGKDNRSCVKVRSCGQTNGGCDDKCVRKGDSYVCSCTTPGKVLGKDHKTCVQGCSPLVACTISCQHGFQTDKNRCAICKCKPSPPGPGNGNVVVLIAQTFYPTFGVSPRLLVQLERHPSLGNKAFVPDNCYGTQTNNRYDPYKVYFIKNRFPVIGSYVQNVLTPSIFRFTVSPFGNVPTYVHCNCNVCPSNSENCEFKKAKIPQPNTPPPVANDEDQVYQDEFSYKSVYTVTKIESV